MKKSLMACSFLFALSQVQDDKKLHDLKLAVIGEWKGHPNGPFKLELVDLEQIKTNFENGKIDIVADFEHASLWNEKAPATGWIKELYIKDDELWAKVHWLNDALELIKQEQYKYASPVFDQHTIDQVTGEDIGWSLHSVALTNRPFLEELGEVIANNKQFQIEGEKEMNKDDKKEMEDLKEENKKLTEAANAAEEKRVTDEIDTAIAAKKIHPDQKDSLMAFGKSNPEGLTSLLASSKTVVSKPDDDLYANNKDGENKKIDVLKLGGIE